MSNTFRLLLATASLISGACASAPEATIAASPQSGWAASNGDWVAPIAPFRITDGVFYVGSEGLSSFLIETGAGLILLDGGLPENAPLILESTRALGHDPRNIRYLLNSHAHIDHSGGLAALKAATGALLVASAGDRAALETGLVPGSEDNPDYAAPPVKVDRVIADGEALTLGGVALTARVTPGHTQGCTTWTMRAGDKDIVLFCSATVAANRLVDPVRGPQYPGIAMDYRRTFAMTADWRPDIFLANHPSFFRMAEKRARLEAGEQDAFVDREEFPAFMARTKADFERELARQEAAAAALP
jgi:metallo-beta-lactamase class B